MYILLNVPTVVDFEAQRLKKGGQCISVAPIYSPFQRRFLLIALPRVPLQVPSSRVSHAYFTKIRRGFFCRLRLSHLVNGENGPWLQIERLASGPNLPSTSAGFWKHQDSTGHLINEPRLWGRSLSTG